MHDSKAYDFAQCEYGKGDCEKDYYGMDIDNTYSPRYVKEIELPIGKYTGYYVSHNMQGVSSVYNGFFIPGIGFALSEYIDNADIVNQNIVDEYSLIGAVINGQTYGIITTVEEVKSVKPSSIKISAHPNPFNSNTIISFVLPENNYTVLSVFNIQGQKVETLKDCFLPAGNHSLIWNASGLSSGIYFLRIKAGNYNSVCRVLLMK